MTYPVWPVVVVWVGLLYLVDDEVRGQQTGVAVEDVLDDGLESAQLRDGSRVEPRRDCLRLLAATLQRGAAGQLVECVTRLNSGIQELIVLKERLPERRFFPFNLYSLKSLFFNLCWN